MQQDAEYDQLVTSLVQGALALPPAERDAYLRSTCTVNQKLADQLSDEVKLRLQRAERGDPVFAAGQIVGERFRILRELGHGGMGVVYEAHDEKLDRRVAIKCALRGLDEQLSPEARAALEVSHPNVCKLHELHTTTAAGKTIDFLTMELIAGETLARRIRRGGPLPARHAREIALQICAGLSQVHRQGVIHGDLKPANVILSRSPEGYARAVLMDFGLAKLRQSRGAEREPGSQGGTAGYMAPELLQGARPSVASDIFALGKMLREMVAGRPDAQVALNTPWKRIVSRCLAPDPEQRFGSVEEISRILAARRSPLRWALATALPVMALLGFLLWRAGETPGPPVRLAMLPIEVDGPPIAAAAGIGVDVADRLSGAGRHFTVIAPGEAARNQVTTAARARSVLGATHVLRTRLHREGDSIAASAAITDAVSGNTLRELTGTYPANDAALLAKALLASVTGAFDLRNRMPRETVSSPAYPFYVQAAAVLREGQKGPDEAIPLFQKAAQLDPRSALPYAGLADAQMQKFDAGGGNSWLEQAAANVAQAVSRNTDSVPVLLASGYLHQEHGQWEKAVADYARAAKLDAANADAWRRLAKAYEKTNRATEAIATYRQALNAQPDYYRNYLDFGNFYLFRSQYPEAEALYRRVTALAPGLFSGHMNLGLALMQQGRFPEAEQSLLRALRIDRNARVLSNIGALYFVQERYAEAARLGAESLAAGPPTALRYANLGDAFRHLGRAAEAADAYRRARTLAEDDVARDPRQASSRAMVGMISAELGETRRAELELAQALALDPDNVMVMREAAVAYEALGRHEQALAILRGAPAYLLADLSRYPDLKQLKNDPRFRSMMAETSNRPQ